MPISNYHAMVGRQGRGLGAGYQGTRYDSPLSSFTSRMAMRPIAEPADEPAQKAVVETPSPVEAIKEVAQEKPTVSEDAGQGDVGSTLDGFSAPETAFDSAVMSDMMGDLTGLATGGLVKGGLVTGLASTVADVPFSDAAKFGLQSIAPSPVSAVQSIGNIGLKGLAYSRTRDAYEGLLGDETGPAKLSAMRADPLASEQYSPPPAPEDVSLLTNTVKALDTYSKLKSPFGMFSKVDTPEAESSGELSDQGLVSGYGDKFGGYQGSMAQGAVGPSGPAGFGGYGSASGGTGDVGADTGTKGYGESSYAGGVGGYGPSGPAGYGGYGSLRSSADALARSESIGGSFGGRGSSGGGGGSVSSGLGTSGYGESGYAGGVGGYGPSGPAGYGGYGSLGGDRGGGGGDSGGGDSSGGGRAGSDAGMSGQGDASGLGGGGFGGFW